MVKVCEFIAVQSHFTVWREGAQYRLQMDLRLLPTVFGTVREAKSFAHAHARRIRTLDNEVLLLGHAAQAERALLAAA